ncbi:yiaY [Symbiodinium natans]|uniref:YiaY protein n=1 Tax=Symbiodinium natans TaxID=878477 RepID=A0A812KYX0_9DINO|nr:yiaY [Symbiodinium natans]
MPSDFIPRCRKTFLALLLTQKEETSPDCWANCWAHFWANCWAMCPSLYAEEAWMCASASTRELLDRKLSVEVVAGHFGKIAPPLLTDPELQPWSFTLLRGKMAPDQLIEHVDLVTSHLAGAREKVKKQTFQFMEEHMPSVLRAEHAQKIAALLGSSDREVRSWALVLLARRMPSKLFGDHFQKVGALLYDSRLAFAAAAMFLDKGHSLSTAQLSLHSEPLRELLRKEGCRTACEEALRKILRVPTDKWKDHETAGLLSKLPVSCLVKLSREHLSEWRDESGNTWLHLAAKAGHLEACKALVDTAGLALRAQNQAGHEPLTLAATREVDRFLRSKMHFQETRFGHGNAYDEMEKEERSVTKVVWYTVPLPGMAGHLGGLHSFLVITVSGGEANQAATRRYVLEKAGSVGREAHQKHGVFIGSQDLGANLTSVPGLRTHKKLSLATTSKLKEGLKVKQLYENAHDTGPYNLASSNCHHAAQRAFNHCCARGEDRETIPPNERLAKIAAPFGLGGLFSSTCSTSEGSGSEVASLKSEVVSSDCRPVEPPSGFGSPVDLHADAFAGTAAALSYAVYVEDAASVLKPAEAGEAVVIYNKLDRAVVVHEHASSARHRLDARKRISIGIQQETVSVDVYAVAWLFPQCLAPNQPMWRGHSYNLTKDFQSEAVVLQEAGKAVVVHNKLDRAMVVYERAADERRKVEAGERISMLIPQEKVTVDVYAASWISGLYRRLLLAQCQPVWRGHVYNVTRDCRSEAVVLQEVTPFDGMDNMDVLHVTRKATSKSPVQWLLARFGAALYLCFRGTDDMQDAAIDLSAVPDCFRFKEHGLGVHGGIAHVLEQEGENVDHVVKEVFKVLNQHRRSGDQLVLCGHSLGGGYAQVMAVHLLSLNVDVSAVRTFGAPHVLVPQAGTAQTMWQKLHAITQHWVHDWDPVPRLPLCQTWLVDVLPRLKKEVVKGVRVGIAQKYIENLQRNCNASSAQMLGEYDVVGQVVLVSMASCSAHVASEGAAPLKELLSERQP